MGSLIQSIVLMTLILYCQLIKITLYILTYAQLSCSIFITIYIFAVMDRLKHIQSTLGKDSTIFDYIVLGAGVSGLQAAEILTKKGFNVLILQAQNKVGGRIGTISISDLPQSSEVSWVLNNRQHFKNVKFQIGATWIQLRHRMTLKLCKQFGVSLKQQYGQGSGLFLENQKSYTVKQLMSSPQYGPALTKFVNNMDQLAATYNKNVFQNKNTSSKQYRQTLAKYDSMTVQAFLNSTIPQKHVRDLVQCFLEHTQCISAKVNSMHEVITKHARSNDVGILKQFLGDFGHQASYLVKNGTGQLIQKFVNEIQKNLKSSIDKILKCQSQVIEVNNNSKEFVTVTTINRNLNSYSKYKAKKVICAVPIITTRNITFSNISEAKKIIIDNQLRTNAIKVFCFFKKPFWRKHTKASGDCLFSYDWALNMCHDISPQDQSCGIIVFFNSGKKYDEWTTIFEKSQDQKEAKRNYMIEMLTHLFKVKKNTKESKQYFDEMFLYECSYMKNPYVKSGFQSNTRPGTFTRILQMGDTLDSFYRDENNIIFVGSEYSKRFASYIEGAIRITREKIFKQIKEVDPLKLTQQEQNDV